MARQNSSIKKKWYIKVPWCNAVFWIVFLYLIKKNAILVKYNSQTAMHSPRCISLSFDAGVETDLLLDYRLGLPIQTIMKPSHEWVSGILYRRA